MGGVEGGIREMAAVLVPSSCSLDSRAALRLARVEEVVPGLGRALREAVGGTEGAGGAVLLPVVAVVVTAALAVLVVVVVEDRRAKAR